MPSYSAYHVTRRSDMPAAVGQLLLSARKAAGLKQQAVARAAGTSPATISMLERGQRMVSPDLLERIVAAVDADAGEIFRIAGTVPPTVATELLGPDLGGIIDEGRLQDDVRLRLRRLRLEEIADEFTAALTETPIDVPRLFTREFQIPLTELAGLEWPRFGPTALEYPSGLDRQVRQRQLAHMAAHAVLSAGTGHSPACHYGTAASTEEEDAEWLGGLIAMPRRLLRRRFQAAVLRFRNEMVGAPQASVLQSALSDVASEFAVPLWYAMRHVADEELLEWLFGGAV